MPFASSKYGPWALVTGASSGLGSEFARQLANEGLNIILVARRRDRLEALAQELESVNSVETRVIDADLTAEGECSRVISETEDLEVGLLVNNAGYGMSGYYHLLDPDRQVNMIVLNCVVPVLLTNHYLPKMIERKRGGLIFLASTAGYQATASFGTYGATKAFNLMLGESLWKECGRYGVDSLAVSPGFTRTEFTDVADIKDAGAFRVATADSVVAAALRNLGRKPSFVHGWLNRFLNFTVRVSPRRTVIAITHAMLKGRSSHT
jgi:short-subunit dehydrogenase